MRIGVISRRQLDGNRFLNTPKWQLLDSTSEAKPCRKILQTSLDFLQNTHDQLISSTYTFDFEQKVRQYRAGDPVGQAKGRLLCGLDQNNADRPDHFARNHVDQRAAAVAQVGGRIELEEIEAAGLDLAHLLGLKLARGGARQRNRRDGQDVAAMRAHWMRMPPLMLVGGVSAPPEREGSHVAFRQG